MFIVYKRMWIDQYNILIAKTIGNWQKKSTCTPYLEDELCELGYQIETRSCKSGAKEKCSLSDTIKVTKCHQHGCPRWAEWENDGNCGPLSCGENGTQAQIKRCKDGVITRCSTKQEIRNISCVVAGYAEICKKTGLI